eukprot:scaffold40.g5162.t1
MTDGLSHLITALSQGYLQPNVGGKNIPTAEGDLSDLAGDEPLFKALYKWFIQYGPVFKLVFGPKAFVVVSDPVVENAFNYDKGVLAEILEPIMGKGLIPADLETWKVRRRAIVPGFHRGYLEACVDMFARCTEQSVAKLDALVDAAVPRGKVAEVDMETEFLSLGLDIIGLGVFNYPFNSITSESPVIKAVYGVLKEAEHRSTFYIPYWNLPLARYVSSDASLLRFLVDVRDADLEAKQLRCAEVEAKAVAEVDEVLGDRLPSERLPCDGGGGVVVVERRENPAFEGAWAGYNPLLQGTSLYPNEVASDFAFLPFGGGIRKCVGDQFALTEATVAMAMLLRRFRFRLVGGPAAVGMATGATIHTAHGLKCTVQRRAHGGGAAAAPAAPAAVAAAG